MPIRDGLFDKSSIGPCLLITQAGGLIMSQHLAAALDGALHLDRQHSCRFFATLSFPFGEEGRRS